MSKYRPTSVTHPPRESVTYPPGRSVWLAWAAMEMTGLHTLESAAWLGGEFDTDCVARNHWASCDNDGHDAGFAYKLSIGSATKHRGHEPGLKVVELCAGIAQAREPDDGRGTKVKMRANWQGN